MPHMPLPTNQIKKLRDAESGKRIFILANGPSINDCDLSFLRNELVIGMNASTLLEEKFNFSSKYYVLSDARFLNSDVKRPWATERLQPHTQRVVRADLKCFDDENLKGRTCYVNALTRDGFSRNLSHGFYYGCTTTMLAIQLAWHIGAHQVYVLGCDLRYPEESPRFYAEDSPQLEDSFISVQLSNIVNSSLEFEKHGRTIVNCSKTSFLRPYLAYEIFDNIFRTSSERI